MTLPVDLFSRDVPTSGSNALVVRQVMPDPAYPNAYIPVRLTDGTNFYNISGSSGGSSSISIGAVSQGAPAALSAPWPVILVSGSDPIGTATHPLYITGTLSTAPVPVQTVTGSVGLSGPVAVSNFPALQQVSGSITGSVGISGPVAVSNFPTIQVVTGSVGVTGPITGTVGLSGPVSISNFPANQTVNGTVSVTPPVIGSPFFVNLVSGSDPVGTQTHPIWITGSVGVTNPTAGGGGGGTVTQGPAGAAPWLMSLVSSTASISNFPATQSVTGTVGLSAPVAVSNFPGSQTVTGSVGLTGPITGTVVLSAAPQVLQGTSPWTVTGSVGLSGPVAVSNLPAVQTVTGSVVAFGAHSLSGTYPTVVQALGFRDPGGLIQAGRQNNAGSRYVAAPGWFGNRIIVGSYRAKIVPVTGSVATQMVASITNPTGSTNNVYIKHINVCGILGNASGSAQKFFYHVGRSAGTPSAGTTLTVQKNRTSQPNPFGIVHMNPTVTPSAGGMWYGSPGLIISGSGGASFVPTPFDIFQEPREGDDVVLAVGETLVVWADANNTGWTHGVSFSWDEGGEV